MSVHNFGICKKNTVVGWRLLIKNVFGRKNLSEFANTLWHSVCKYQGCAQTRIWLSSTFWYRNIWQIWAQIRIANLQDFLALNVCFLQTCSIAAGPQVYHVKITFTLLPTNRLVSTTTNSMKYRVNWIPLKIRVGSRNHYTQGGVGYFSNECGFSVESSLQRISSIFVVETKRFVGSSLNVILTRQTCGQRSSRAAEKQTPSARNLFFRVNLLYVPNCHNVEETEI